MDLLNFIIALQRTPYCLCASAHTFVFLCFSAHLCFFVLQRTAIQIRFSAGQLNDA